MVQASDTALGIIAEIDLNPYVLTEYEVGDYVLRRYPATKLGHANPSKYGAWWRGPYLVTAVTKVLMAYGFEKLWYTIQNLVTIKEHFADIIHLKTFFSRLKLRDTMRLGRKRGSTNLGARFQRHGQ